MLKEDEMNTVMVLGSRNPKGQTARAADAFIEGLTSGGGQSERVFLPHMKIERCRQCEDTGWGTCRSEGRCTIEDDFSPLVEKIRNSDAAVFATPVYFSDLSESMRAFLDRLRRITRHEAGKSGIDGKPAVGICVAGGGGGGGPACAVSLEKVLRTCGFDVVDIVPARRQNLDVKVDVLRITGKWFASHAKRD
ncbi:MAG: flavodoxin family protein [bacterium]